MQVRQVLVASVLAIAAAGAMSQEIDRSETLQAKNLASRKADPSDGRVSAVAQALAADGRAEAGERADASTVGAAPNISWAQRHATRRYAKAWFHGDKRQPRTPAAADLG
jgi:hypothetical protein